MTELPPPDRNALMAFEDADGDWYWNDGRAPSGDYRFAHSKTSALHDAGVTIRTRR